MRMGRDSMTSFNERGCDEIMCQFVKDLDIFYDTDRVDEVEDKIEANNHSSLDLETIM